MLFFKNKIQLSVVSHSAAQSKGAILSRGSVDKNYEPFIEENGRLSYLCGNCSLSLVEGAQETTVISYAYHCPKCHSYNVLHK